jgi:hypothetical protein
LESRLATLLCKKIIVANSNEVKTDGIWQNLQGRLRLKNGWFANDDDDDATMKSGVPQGYNLGPMHFNILIFSQVSRDSSDGMEMGYGLEGQGPILCGSKRFFSSPQRPNRLWGPPASYPMGTGGSILGVRRKGPDADL